MKIETGLGEKFLADAIDAFQAIERNPRRYSNAGYRSRREIRRKIMVHFPYSVIYEVRSTDLLVIAIAHLHRRLGYWRNRL